jgi:non-canonical purine NTP pyrophosphatase (RdgB/HAM1 family)
MANVTFITGNQDKADYLAKYLGFPVDHQKVELEEPQTLDLREVVEYKARHAYVHVRKPVLVEDQILMFKAFGRLPGTFIKFFIDELGLEKICQLLNGFDTRTATAACGMAYYDGQEFVYFEGSLEGKIANHPRGTGGFGWDAIFIPEGYQITRAEMNEEDDRKTYSKLKPLAEVKKFLQDLDKK